MRKELNETRKNNNNDTTDNYNANGLIVPIRKVHVCFGTIFMAI